MSRKAQSRCASTGDGFEMPYDRMINGFKVERDAIPGMFTHSMEEMMDSDLLMSI